MNTKIQLSICRSFAAVLIGIVTLLLPRRRERSRWRPRRLP